MAKQTNEENSKIIKEILESSFSRAEEQTIKGFAKHLRTNNFTIESQRWKLRHLQMFFQGLDKPFSELSQEELTQRISQIEIADQRTSLEYFLKWHQERKGLLSFDDIKRAERQKNIEALLNYPGFNPYQKALMKRFLTYCIVKGHSLATQKSYLQHLKSLLLSLNKEIEKLTKKDIDDYLEGLNNGFKPKTIHEKKVFLLVFIEWFFDKRKEDLPIIKSIDLSGKNNDVKLPEEILSPDEVKRLIQVADNFRDKALVMLLYETASRKGEFLQLRIKHLDLTKKEYGLITIPKGKTTSRKVPIIFSLPLLTDWLNAHPGRDDPESPLFITSHSWLGRALGEDGLKRLLKILGRRAVIKKKIYPHLLRHSRLTELAKELTEQELKKFAGWTANSRMASVYVHLSGNDVSNKILANAGLIETGQEKPEKTLMSIKCPRCEKINSPDRKYCTCGFILDLKEANKMLRNNEEAEANISKFIEPGEIQKLFKVIYKLQAQIEELKNRQ